MPASPVPHASQCSTTCQPVQYHMSASAVPHASQCSHMPASAVPHASQCSTTCQPVQKHMPASAVPHANQCSTTCPLGWTHCTSDGWMVHGLLLHLMDHYRCDCLFFHVTGVTLFSGRAPAIYKYVTAYTTRLKDSSKCIPRTSPLTLQCVIDRKLQGKYSVDCNRP